MTSTSAETANQDSFWKRCNGCKQPIGFATTYWVCSVSTCNRKRTGMVFCSVNCWDTHLPIMRHREAYAVEKRSPRQAEWQRETQQAAATPATSTTVTSKRVAATSVAADRTTAQTSTPRQRIVVTSAKPTQAADEVEREILIVASKLKKYIRARSGLNTSDGVMSVLSDHVRAICDAAIRNAAEDGRKTVLDRDVPTPPQSRGDSG